MLTPNVATANSLLLAQAGSIVVFLGLDKKQTVMETEKTAMRYTY